MLTPTSGNLLKEACFGDKISKAHNILLFLQNPNEKLKNLFSSPLTLLAGKKQKARAQQ